MPSLETILSHERCFGLTTISDVQRAACRVIDGRPLDDLASNPTVIRTFGGPEAIEKIETLRKAFGRPFEYYLIAAIRTGKSLLMAARAFHAAITFPRHPMMKRYEHMRVSVLSLDRDKAKAIMNHLKGALLRDGSALKRYLAPRKAQTEDTLWIRRDDGTLVEILIAAGKRGGGSLVSRWTCCVIFDEAGRMLGQEDGIVNYEDQRAAAVERVRLMNGQMLAVTSPWAARGPIYEATQESFGLPSYDLIVQRGTGPEVCPLSWTPEACEKARKAKDGSYTNDVLGEFVDAESGWLTAMECRARTRTTGEYVGYDQLCEFVSAMDPAVSGNAWSLVIAGKRLDEMKDDKDRYFIAGVWEWQGTTDAPLKAREVFADIAPILREYKLSEVFSDRYAGSLIAEHGDLCGITVRVSRDTPEQTAKNHADFRTLLLDGKLELSPSKQFIADLLSKRIKRMPNGTTKYEAPTTKDGRHADQADAAVLAVARLRGGPAWTTAMDRLRKRGGHI